MKHHMLVDIFHIKNYILNLNINKNVLSVLKFKLFKNYNFRMFNILNIINMND